AVTLLLIWIYTYQGGIRTIVYTDAIQTGFMLLAVILTLVFIGRELQLGPGGMISAIRDSDYGQVFFWDSGPKSFFWKQFLSGAAIATVMTGLDQDMMQKNNSCPNIRDAQKNMFTFSVVLVLVNILFVGLGALLYIYGSNFGIELPLKTDHVYPALALNQFPLFFGAVFLIGLIAAAFSSADSALTALTTSFCVDILGFKEGSNDGKSTRYMVHLSFSFLILIICYVFYTSSGGDVLGNLFRAAGFTYGPLLGLYMFGLFTKREIKDKLAPFVCVLAVAICLYFAGQDIVGGLAGFSPERILAWKNDVKTLLGGYEIGFEILIYNGILTSLGLFAISSPSKKLTN
ncbi:MAG: Na+/proline symporter, partial [Limisphaerales bacterium]